MSACKFRTATWLSTLALGIVVTTIPALCGAKTPVHQRASTKSATGTRAAILAVVAQFEQAYQHRDKKVMLFKLMVPTTDEATLEKRYQWFRGYGPHDMPGSAHPPILFETSKGSFVPSSYTVSAVAPAERGRWSVTVHEQGTYHDEDGRYKVSRIRRYTITMYKGKWYVMDYVLQENPEDYGFYVDDIIDKMVHVGK